MNQAQVHASSRPDQPEDEPVTVLDLRSLNAHVDIDEAGDATMLIWDGDVTVELHPGIQGSSTAASAGVQILTAVLEAFNRALQERARYGETPSLESAHEPSRPDWDCATCAASWPCEGAKEYLARQSPSRRALAAILGGCLMEAVDDLPDVPVSVLYPRFLSWLRQPARP